MKRFDNRTVIVTAVAREWVASHARLRRRGANVVIADVLEQEGRTLADKTRVRAISPARVTSESGMVGDGRRREAPCPVSDCGQQPGIVRSGPDSGDRAGRLAPE